MTNVVLGFSSMSKMRTKTLSIFAMQPLNYILFVLFTVFATLIYQLRIETIFACQATMYSSDRYIASCNGTHYADYEHGAFAFDLEPRAENFARDADVLFLGNSRLQYAFSTSATTNWFFGASVRYYLLGFTYFENMEFAEELLREIRPRAKIYVINVDDFFNRSETPPVKTILHDPSAQTRYEAKRFWQRVHEPLCKVLALICRHEFAIFRSRETGAYYADGKTKLEKATPISYDDVISRNGVDSNTANAIDFLREFTRGKCVILTLVPSSRTKIGEADAIAAALGMKLVALRELTSLQTWDGYHLDQPSAERWSQAFFQAAGSKIRSCLDERSTITPVGSSHQSVAH
jgi:hypothetical protein